MATSLGGAVILLIQTEGYQDLVGDGRIKYEIGGVEPTCVIKLAEKRRFSGHRSVF
jgi:hypothetical protein